MYQKSIIFYINIRYNTTNNFATGDIPAQAGIQFIIFWIPCQARNVIRLNIQLWYDYGYS